MQAPRGVTANKLITYFRSLPVTELSAELCSPIGGHADGWPQQANWYSYSEQVYVTPEELAERLAIEQRHDTGARIGCLEK